MKDVFERVKDRVGRVSFFFENFKNGCNVIIFAITTQLSILCHHPFSNTSFNQKSPGHPKVGVSQSLRPDICTKYRDNGFCVDLGYFGHFRDRKIVGGRSQVDRLLLELEDWITAGQVSAGAGLEARGDWIRGKWKEVGADGSSREAIHDGGLWKFLTVRQIYLLSNRRKNLSAKKKSSISPRDCPNIAKICQN